MSNVLPHNWETERAVLGGLLLAPAWLPEVQMVLKPEQFHRPGNRMLYELIGEVAARGLKTDLMVILHEIEARGISESVGGVSYVIALPQACMFVDNIVSYARSVADVAVKRNVVLAAREIEEKIIAGKFTARDAIALSEGLIRDVAAQLPAEKGRDWVPQADILRERLEDIRQRTGKPDQIPGTPTGITDLDKKIGGWQRQKFYLIAGRPAMGKSAVAQCSAEHGAQYGDVGIITLEMPKEEIGERALIQEGRVNSTRVRDGSITTDDWTRLLDAEERLSARPVWVDDSPNASISQIWAKVRRLKERCPNLHTVFLDYIQLATADPKKGQGGQSRQQEVGAISRGCKAMSKEFNIAVVALAQLSRKCEERTDKRPVPSDLREAGDLEQDADAILFVYRDEVYEKESTKRGIAEIIVGKNRGGPTGTVECAWIGHEYRIANLSDNTPPTSDRWSGYQ